MNMDNKPQTGGEANSLQATPADVNCNCPDPVAVSHAMPSPLDDQGKISLSYSSQASQGIQSSIGSPGLQSISSPSMLPTLTNLTDTTRPNGVGPSYNLQSVSGVSQNSVGYASGNYATSNIFTSSQRQMQGRQHAQYTIAQQHQQQTQKAPLYIYQQQQKNHLLKQNSHGNMQTSTMQSHIQQPHNHRQNSLQKTQLQFSPPSLMHKSSGSHSSPSTLQQAQPSFIQSSQQSSLQQNLQSSIQQFKPSVLHQLPLSVIRQYQQTQQSLHQQQSPGPLQSMLSSRQNQRLMGKQPDEANRQQNQTLGQPSNNVPDTWHQQEQWLSGQKNNLTKQQLQQQQQCLSLQNEISNFQHNLGQQSNVSGTKQQQMLGSQPGVSNISLQHSVHIMQQAKVAEEQRQTQQAASNLFPTQRLQSQSKSAQQQPISQLQMQPAHLQQQLDSQRHPISLHGDVHQWIPKSNALLESENSTEWQKQLFQSQKMCSKASSSSINSGALTGLTNTVGGGEEVYQRIKTLKRMYLPALSEIWNWFCNYQQTIKPEHSEKLKSQMGLLEFFLRVLHMTEDNISTDIKEKLDSMEKQIFYFINGFRHKRSGLSQQQGPQQLQTFVDHHQQTQVHQVQHHENQLKPPMQPRNLKSVMTAIRPTGISSMHQGSIPPSLNHLGIPALHAEMINTLKTGSNIESTHQNTPNPLQLQQSPAGSLQKFTMNATQQAQMKTSLQPNPNVLLNHRLRQQEQQLIQAQQLKKQLQHHQMSQQFIPQQEQQTMQHHHQKNLQIQNHHQQRHQQQKLEQWNQLLSHQMPQLHQTSEVKDLKARQSIGAKSGKFQHNSPGQHLAHDQSLKTGSPFSISSPLPIQAASPQISQQSSPQTDQQNMISSLSKAGTPLQFANSPIIAFSPSTSLAPSPAQGDLEKQNSGVSSHSNAGSIVEQQTVSLSQPQSVVISTPGISASPLLAESVGMESNQVITPVVISEKTFKAEPPHQRLFNVIKSIARGNAYSISVGEKLVAAAKRSLHTKEFNPDDGIAARKKMRCQAVAMPLNAVLSNGCVKDKLKPLNGHDVQDLWSTAISKSLRAQAYHIMVQEIKEINQELLTTVVDISDKDGKLTSAAAEDGEGIIVKCSFSALALSPDLKSRMLPVLPVQLLVSTNYPNCSPVLLDKWPVNLSKDYELLFMKAKSWFIRSLRFLSQPMSLGEMAKIWDACAGAAMMDYALQDGGGSFSSRYSAWQNCVNTI